MSKVRTFTLPKWAREFMETKFSELYPISGGWMDPPEIDATIHERTHFEMGLRAGVRLVLDRLRETEKRDYDDSAYGYTGETLNKGRAAVRKEVLGE